MNGRNLAIARDYFTALADPALERLVAELETPYRDLALLVRDVGNLATDGFDALTEQQARDLTLRVATALANPFIETDAKVSGMLVVWLTQRVTALEEMRRELLGQVEDLHLEKEKADDFVADAESRLDDIQDDAASCGLDEDDFKKSGIYDLRRRIQYVMDDILESDEANFLDPDVPGLLDDLKAKAAKVDELEYDLGKARAQVAALEQQVDALESRLDDR